MVNSVAHMAITTVTLIAMCVLGIAGGVENVASYNNVIVIVPTFTAAFAIGGFIVSSYDDDRVTAHEYGHIQQERMYGVLYMVIVGIPSILNFFGVRESQVELQADILGGL